MVLTLRDCNPLIGASISFPMHQIELLTSQLSQLCSGMKSAIGFFLFIVCLLCISISTSSCFGCRSLDGDDSRLPVIEIVLAPSSSAQQHASIVSSYTRRRDLEEFSWTFHASRDDLFSLDQTGSKFFINSNYFDAETNRTGISLAASDSLSFCSFTRTSGDALCVVTSPDTLHSTFLNRSMPVKVAKSSISIWEDLRNTPVELYGDSARFISEDQYQITTVLHPVLSNDNRHLAFIRQQQTRRILLEETGTIVDDILVAAQNDLVVLNTTADQDPEVLLANVSIDEQLSRHLAISPDGNRVALAQDDGNIHLVHVQSTFTTQLEGVRYPEFSSSSRFLIGATDPRSGMHDLKIFNLDDNAVQDTLTNVQNTYSVDAFGDFIFYYNFQTATTESGLRAYSIIKGTETILFKDTDFDEYERNTSNGSRGAGLILFPFIGTDSNGRIHFITEVDFYLLDEC